MEKTLDCLKMKEEIQAKIYNELDKARRNAEYLAKLDKSVRQVAEGRVIVKTMEELEAMAE